MMSFAYHGSGVHTANMPLAEQELSGLRPLAVRPFVTIASQAGAECMSLPRRLAAMLNQRDPCEPSWSFWDQELVERASVESRIPAGLIASLETTGYSWVDDVLSDISGRPDEVIVLHRLRDTARGLARAGNAILVGHGSTFMTGDLTGGLHVRLIAPVGLRIKNLAARLNISPDKAARQVRRFDRRRRAFFHHFWPNRTFGPEIFAAMLNVAELDEDALIRTIATMLPQKCPDADPEGPIQ